MHLKNKICRRMNFIFSIPNTDTDISNTHTHINVHRDTDNHTQTHGRKTGIIVKKTKTLTAIEKDLERNIDRR